MCYIQRIVCIRYIGFNYHEVVNRSLFEVGRSTPRTNARSGSCTPMGRAHVETCRELPASHFATMPHLLELSLELLPLALVDLTHRDLARVARCARRSALQWARHARRPPEASYQKPLIMLKPSQRPRRRPHRTGPSYT